MYPPVVIPSTAVRVKTICAGDHVLTPYGEIEIVVTLARRNGEVIVLTDQRHAWAWADVELV